MLPASGVVHRLGTTGHKHLKSSESGQGSRESTAKVKRLRKDSLRVWRELEPDIEGRTAGGVE